MSIPTISPTLALYKFHFDAGRAGDLHGVFVAKPDELETLVASKERIYFGEVLGKHSEICGPIDSSDFTLVTDNPEKVNWAVEAGLCFGFNPFDYLKEAED